jgi:hypothetical protein
MPQPANVESLTRFITDEIFNALGLPRKGWARNTFGPIFNVPARRFSEIFARIDQDVAQYGYYEAARRALPIFVKGFEVRGAEHVPKEGPLIIASNHPGAYDSVVISANIPRADLKVLATGVAFLRALPILAEHLIYVTYNSHERMNALRAAMRHLEQGGAVLIFPTGVLDPDPANQSGADQALERWSPSLELMLRKVPQAKTLVTIVSGVLEAKWLRNPLVRLQKEGLDQRRLAEFFQIMQQLVLRREPPLIPRVSFAAPLTVAELKRDGQPKGLLEPIIMQAKSLLNTHLVWNFSTPDEMESGA